VQQVISSNTTETLRVTRCSLIYIILTYPIRSSCHTGFGQNLGGFASPQSGFGAARLSSGLGGLGGKTSPSSFGSGLGGVFAGSATQQTQGFGGTSTFGAGGGFGAPQQQQQVTYLYPILHYLILSENIIVTIIVVSLLFDSEKHTTRDINSHSTSFQIGYYECVSCVSFVTGCVFSFK
jgi:hypothetical protein